MKDAMDTYFEEKKERDRQRQIERQRWDEEIAVTEQKKYFFVERLFLYFTNVYFIGSAFAVIEIFSENLSKDSGFILFTYVLRIPLGILIPQFMEKPKYASLFYILLWIQTFSILIEFFYTMEGGDLIFLFVLLAQIFFLRYFYRHKKRLFPTSDSEKQTEDKGQL